MRSERTSCTHRGHTFFGEYQRLDGDHGTAVRVRYKGEKLEAKVGDHLTELVARDLLHELVIRETIALKVTEAVRALAPQKVR